MGFNWRRDRSRQAGDWRLLLSDRFRIVGLSHSVAILLPFCRLTAGGLPQGNGSWRPANTRFLVSHLDLAYVCAVLASRVRNFHRISAVFHFSLFHRGTEYCYYLI